MIVVVNDYRKLVEEVEKDGFEQITNPGVPVLDFKKGEIRFCIRNGQVHVDEKSLEYIESKNFKYSLVEE